MKTQKIMNAKNICKIVIIFTILAIIVNIILSVSKKSFILLEENQIYYTYSSIGQIVGAILGLIIAGFGIIEAKYSQFQKNDIPEVTKIVHNDNFTVVLYISINSVLVILNSIICIVSFNNFHHSVVIFFMNLAVILFLSNLVLLIIFICTLSPKYFEHINNIEFNKILDDLEAKNVEKTINDNEDKTTNVNEKNTINVSESYLYNEFIYDFSKLENICREIAKSEAISQGDVFFGSNISDGIANQKLSRVLDYLSKKNILSREIRYMIDEYIKDYDILQNSPDFPNKVFLINSIKDKMRNITLYLEEYSKPQTNDYSKKYLKELHEYGRENAFSGIDEQIIDYLRNNNIHCTINSIYSFIGKDKDRIERAVKRLIKAGFVKALKENDRIFYVFIDEPKS
jgi:hypothetical protein